MDKTTKKTASKKQYVTYNSAIIKQLKNKYGLTTQFIGQSLRGERTSATSIKICEDYKRMDAEIKKAIKDI